MSMSRAKLVGDDALCFSLEGSYVCKLRRVFDDVCRISPTSILLEAFTSKLEQCRSIGKVSSRIGALASSSSSAYLILPCRTL